MPTERPPMETLLFVTLTLRESQRELEESWLDAYREVARGVTGVVLILPSVYEAPDALYHLNTLAGRHIAAIDMAGLTLHLGRRAWVTWPNHVQGDFVQSPRDTWLPSYYARLLGTLDAEARSVGAAGTALDCEAYGDCIFKERFRAGLPDYDRLWVRNAIREARRVAPAATLVYPASSNDPTKYHWVVRGLGEHYLHHKTYKLPGPPALADPPPGVDVQLDYWGTWLVNEPVSGPWPHPLTVNEWREIDWGKVKAAYPELKGRWLYVKRDELLRVMYRLGGIET